MSYNYQTGDGLSVIDETKPDGSAEGVEILDDAIRQIKAYLKDMTANQVASAYPVGSIYLNASNNTNPATLLGFGTWVAIQDVFLLAAGGSYSAGSTGGAATHTLTVDELPAHTHGITGSAGNEAGNAAVGGEDSPPATALGNTDSTGGGSAHNNMPPYLTVYAWRRTA